MLRRVYGCFNRKPFNPTITAQDGTYNIHGIITPRMVELPFVMSPDCQYSRSELGQVDGKCLGCKWKAAQ